MEVDQTVNINDISCIPPETKTKESTLLDFKKKAREDPLAAKQKQNAASSDYSAVKSSGYGPQSINKNRMLCSNKGKPGLSSSKSTSSLMKPAAAHKLNLPPNQQSALANRGRSPGAGKGGAPPRLGSPNYAQSTMSSSNKSSTLERKPKGTENQKPGSGGVQIKSGTSLKR